jgi:hypothetical protein
VPVFLSLRTGRAIKKDYNVRKQKETIKEVVQNESLDEVKKLES